MFGKAIPKTMKQKHKNTRPNGLKTQKHGLLKKKYLYYNYRFDKENLKLKVFVLYKTN